MTAGSEPTIYVCRDFTCDRPVTNTAELANTLARLVNRQA